MSRKRIALIALHCTWHIVHCSLSTAQQRPVYSHYLYSPLLINPAYAGNQPQLQLQTLHRDQWINFEGAPTTSLLMADIGLEDRSIGVGLVMQYETIGVHTDVSLYASYAYKISWLHSQISFGLQAGINSRQSDYRRVNVFQPNDPLFQQFIRQTSPNFGVGVFYRARRAYVGVSVPYLVNNQAAGGDSLLSNIQERRYYYLLAGKLLGRDQWRIRPSLLWRLQEGQPMAVDLNVHVFYDELLIAGLGYRYGDALVMQLGLRFTPQLTFTYAYDYTLSRIGQYTPGSHEFRLLYRLPFNKKCNTYF